MEEVVRNKFIITEHAVEQYIKRWRKGITHYQAKEQLRMILNGASIQGKTYDGQIYISGEYPDIRIVVKDRNVAITVLPALNNDNGIEEYHGQE